MTVNGAGDEGDREVSQLICYRKQNIIELQGFGTKWTPHNRA